MITATYGEYWWVPLAILYAIATIVLFFRHRSFKIKKEELNEN